jgi:HEAT repeat protein
MIVSPTPHVAASPATPSGERATFFCPACWEQVAASATTCTACGTDIARFLAENDYGAQLINTLRHPDARRRLMAAWILGERRERRALAALRHLALTEARDVYLAKAAVGALAKIGGPDAADALQLARVRHPARLVRQAAALSSGTVQNQRHH